MPFQSTLPTRGSDPSPPWRRRLKNVSIHAPHEGERPAGSAAIARATGSFNPRSPRGGATAGGLADLTRELFQSTLPTRGSDKAKYRPGASRTCFNPRSPRGGATSISVRLIVPCTVSIHAPHEGERPLAIVQQACGVDVSIHAPHEGERQLKIFLPYIYMPFQSTLPTRGSDPSPPWRRRLKNVSIHAPHEGERPSPQFPCGTVLVFQSTLPTRGSDWDCACKYCRVRVSIHAPHEGERHRCTAILRAKSSFQSTLPTRGSDSLKI